MFESNELNRIETLQIRKNELLQHIKSINPASIMKEYILARSNYRKAVKVGKITKQIKETYASELERIANELGSQVNVVLTLSNKAVRDGLDMKYADEGLDDKKIEYKNLSTKIEKLIEKDKLNRTVGTSKRRLNTDAANVLEYYTKKIPQVNVLDSQIAILEEEATVYQVKGLRDNYNKTLEVIKELKSKRKSISNKFKNKTKVSPEVYKARMEMVNKDTRYIELNARKRDLKLKLQKNSADKIARNFKFAKSNLESIVLDFDDNTTVEIEQEYYTQLDNIVEITGEPREVVSNLSNSKIRTLLNEKLDQAPIKEELNVLHLEINDVKNEIIGIETTETILAEIFDYENDETEGKIPKEVLVANNLDAVQGIVGNLCYKLNKMHYYDDALSGGLMGLTVAVNTWYEKQRNHKSAIKFAEFSNVYVSMSARRALELVQNMGTTKSGSASATARTREKERKANAEKLINQYMLEHPNMIDMKNEMISELLEVEVLAGNNEYAKKLRAGVVTETDYNAVISGGDGAVDMWALSEYDKQTHSADDVVDAKQTYNTILTSINNLMDLFDVKQISGSEQYQVNQNRKLMDAYDRKIFLMKTGLEHKRTANEASKSKEYTLEEIAAEIVQMKKANGEVNATMAITSITARWKNIIKKLKIAVDMDPKLKKGLEYMLTYIDNNRSIMQKLSNDREEINIKNDRDMLKDNYGNNDDIMDIEMLDSSRLGDDYDLAVSNELSEFDNLEL